MTNLSKVIVWILLFSPAAAYAAPAPSPAVRRACHEDAQKLCSSVLSEPEKRRACMREHREQLSEECRTAIMEQRTRRMQKSGGE
jgi:hypothetical protein